MKTIALLAFAATVLLDIFSPKSSVGGPMADLLLAVLVIWAVAIREGWSKRRGLSGWIVNIVVSLIGGFVALSLFGAGMEMLLGHLHVSGSVAQSDRPWRYVLSAGLTVVTILGSWLPLLTLNRLFPNWR